MRRSVWLPAFVVVIALLGAMPQYGMATGLEWREIGQPNALFGSTGDAVIDPTNPDHIVVTGFYGRSRQSWDGGHTWEDIILPGQHRAPNDLTTNVYCIEGTWFFNSWGAIYQTQDLRTFTTVVDLEGEHVDFFWTDGQKFFLGLRAGGPDCFFRSLDGGKTWESGGQALRDLYLEWRALRGYSGTSFGVSRIVVCQSRVYVNNMFFSDDWGLTWETVAWLDRMSGELKSFSDRLFCLEPLGQGSLSDDVRLHESRDNGDTWKILCTVSLSCLPRAVGMTCSEEFLYLSGYSYSPSGFFPGGIGVLCSRDRKLWFPLMQGLSKDSLAHLPAGWLASVPPIVKVFDGQVYLFVGTSLFKLDSEPYYLCPTTMILRIGHTDYSVNTEPAVMETAPVIRNDRTFLPPGPLAEFLGATVGWDPDEGKVTVVRKEIEIELWIGHSTARVNGRDVSIDPSNSAVSPYISDDGIMLPLRFICEHLGAELGWEPVEQMITIRTFRET